MYQRVANSAANTSHRIHSMNASASRSITDKGTKIGTMSRSSEARTTAIIGQAVSARTPQGLRGA
jgi:hypothetical protein